MHLPSIKARAGGRNIEPKLQWGKYVCMQVFGKQVELCITTATTLKITALGRFIVAEMQANRLQWVVILITTSKLKRAAVRHQYVQSD